MCARVVLWCWIGAFVRAAHKDVRRAQPCGLSATHGVKKKVLLTGSRVGLSTVRGETSSQRPSAMILRDAPHFTVVALLKRSEVTTRQVATIVCPVDFVDKRGHVPDMFVQRRASFLKASRTIHDVSSLVSHVRCLIVRPYRSQAVLSSFLLSTVRRGSTKEKAANQKKPPRLRVEDQ